MESVSRFENGPLNVTVRIANTPEGPKFVLIDLVKALGYRDTANASHLLRPAQMTVSDQATKNQLGIKGRAPVLVTESGFYRLCLRSQRPEAEAFQVWVEDEVLPAIRKDGLYISPDITPSQTARAVEYLSYKELRDVIWASEDYSSTDSHTRSVYARVQNRFHLAVTGKTAKQLIASRDIVRWEGRRGATKHDRGVGKNYLTDEELVRYTALGKITLGILQARFPTGGYDLEAIEKAVTKALTLSAAMRDETF